MKWEKLGHIFNPTDYNLPNDCHLFAQSPQTLVFDDFVRIYFSTRATDKKNGKYLSHIAYVDMKKNLRDVIGVAQNTVIPLGELGAFDEHGIFPMNVVRHGDLIYGYTCGWNRRVSVSVDTAVGLAISRDQGNTFLRTGPGPVLAASLHEPCLVGDGFVKIIDQIFHMWYIFGTGWKNFEEGKPPDRTYKIGHAVSTDGIHWVKEEARQIISDLLGPDESQALPTVITIGRRHHMFFCFRQSSDFRTANGRGYRIGHAWSDDLQNWNRDGDSLALPINPGEWDSDMQCYPHVFECDGKVYLLYNGNEFGKYGFGLARLVMDAAPDYRLNQATELQIEQHLQRCDASFIPSLGSRVSIPDYARKIKGNALCFEAWSGDILGGLVAVYCNNQDQSGAFITSVSVLPEFARQGIAKTLLQQCIAHLRSMHANRISLEVGTDNIAAKNMYDQLGFEVRTATSGLTTMELNLK